MRAFENGERKFVKGQVVFLIDTKIQSLIVGMIDCYKGHGEYYVDLLTPKETRLVNGTPIQEIDYSKEYPLPKKWTYNTSLIDVGNTEEYEEICSKLFGLKIGDRKSDKAIKRAVSEGIFVPRKETIWGYVNTEVSKNTYKIKFVPESRPTYMIVNEKFIFYDSISAKKELDIYRKKHDEEIKMIKNMSDEEYSWYEIENVLNGRNISKEEKERCIALIKAADYLPPIEDLIIRRFGNEIQWQNGRKWDTLMELNLPKEEQHTERYYYHVTNTWDLDENVVEKGYRDEFPDDVVEKYKNYEEYIFHIADRSWTLERGLEVPTVYKNGVRVSSSSGFESVLYECYSTKDGIFEIVDGELINFDISINKKFELNNFAMYVYGGTSRSDKEIKEIFMNKIGSVTGKFEKLFKERINEMDEIRVL